MLLIENTNSAHSHGCLSQYLLSTKEIQLRFDDILDSEKRSSVKITLAAHTFITKKQSNIPWQTARLGHSEQHPGKRRNQ